MGRTTGRWRITNQWILRRDFERRHKLGLEHVRRSRHPGLNSERTHSRDALLHQSASHICRRVQPAHCSQEQRRNSKFRTRQLANMCDRYSTGALVLGLQRRWTDRRRHCDEQIDTFTSRKCKVDSHCWRQLIQLRNPTEPNAVVLGLEPVRATRRRHDHSTYLTHGDLTWE